MNCLTWDRSQRAAEAEVPGLDPVGTSLTGSIIRKSHLHRGHLVASE